MPELTIPYNYKPRHYQQAFWRAFDSGKYNRFVQVWHRRSGKDITDFNLVVREALREAQIITYVFPTLVMGRQILWEGMDNDGNKFIERYIPKEVVEGKPNDTRMTINFKNGSIFRVGGSDTPDSLRGGNTKLFILSEWSEQDPYTWTVIRPILLANKGKALFNYTPKGNNHAKGTFELAQSEMEKGGKWWCQKLTVDDTKLFTPQELEQELKELIEEHGEAEGKAKYEQEYMCSFDAPVIGSYFGEAMKKAESEGRVTSVPYDASVPVNTVWDLGVGDSNVLWFYQIVGKEIHVIDLYASSGVGIEHYSNVMKGSIDGYERMAKYSYGIHYAPHDIEVTELGTGKTRLETALSFGINFQVAAKLGVDDGIEAARRLISRSWFDKEKCEQGISALKNYHKDWDEKNKVYRPYPKHDWSSHYADAYRYMAITMNESKIPDRTHERVQTKTDLGLLPHYTKRRTTPASKYFS